jgi:hypothetical protein
VVVFPGFPGFDAVPGCAGEEPFPGCRPALGPRPVADWLVAGPAPVSGGRPGPAAAGWYTPPCWIEMVVSVVAVISRAAPAKAATIIR